MVEWHVQEMQFITERQSQGPTPFQLCPPALFGAIITINAQRTRTSAEQHDAIREAFTVLQRIHEFSPGFWARSKPMGQEHWEFVGRTYQAAVALYLILSLQSVFILPQDTTLWEQRAAYAQGLHTLLVGSLSNPRIKRFMLWPLVVLGVQAASGLPATRLFVADQLVELSYHVGSYSPIEAKLVLEMFWASGDTRWDSCFDKPYAFITQSAVDLAGISPSSTPGVFCTPPH